MICLEETSSVLILSTQVLQLAACGSRRGTDLRTGLLHMYIFNMTLLNSVHLPDQEVLSKAILQLIIVAMEGTQGENLIFLGQLWADRHSHPYFGDKLSAVGFNSC